MLIKNPDERISAKEAFEHPWIKAVKDDEVP
jgi:serine/threonine protein kinase